MVGHSSRMLTKIDVAVQPDDRSGACVMTVWIFIADRACSQVTQEAIAPRNNIRLGNEGNIIARHDGALRYWGREAIVLLRPRGKLKLPMSGTWQSAYGVLCCRRGATGCRTDRLTPVVTSARTVVDWAATRRFSQSCPPTLPFFPLASNVCWDHPASSRDAGIVGGACRVQLRQETAFGFDFASPERILVIAFATISNWSVRICARSIWRRTPR